MSIGTFQCTDGNRHDLLTNDGCSYIFPRSSSIGTVPQPLTKGATIDLFWLLRINSQALCSQASELRINHPFLIVLTRNGQGFVRCNVYFFHAVPPAFDHVNSGFWTRGRRHWSDRAMLV